MVEIADLLMSAAVCVGTTEISEAYRKRGHRRRERELMIQKTGMWPCKSSALQLGLKLLVYTRAQYLLGPIK